MKKRHQINSQLGEKLWDQIAFKLNGQIRCKLKVIVSNSLTYDFVSAAPHGHLRTHVYCNLKRNNRAS
jgi:hypothetical protein